ncbi:bacteriocin immunity protein [Ligilactobacillus salivarius]|uniref:bacteriocin immunity protein n=1 Tax=Ligilactobacillus salivarius TaxID=1624 RepID=UPI0015BD67AA|nr:bacteriocin immunity protein [Ligilactobacillus salivarius]MBD5789637.1 bacteriocin immunity protein [Ligilactobacillus salivarius]
MERTKLINQAQTNIKELLGILNNYEKKQSELLDIIDVLAQVYRKLPETKNPEALLNRLVNYIRSVALAGQIHFPTNEEKLIADIGVLGQRAGLNGVYMADYSAKSQFYSIFEEIPRH